MSWSIAIELDSSRRLWRLRHIKAQIVELNGCLKQILITLSLCFGLDPIVPPHINAVPLHQHSICLWVVLDSLPEAGSQLALPGCVVDDGHNACIIVPVTSNPL